MFRLLDIALLALERLNQHRILVIWVLVGLSVATTLTLSLALYVDAVYSDLLASRLGEPPFAFRFRYLGAWNGNITPGDVERTSAFIQDRFVEPIGLPVARQVGFMRAGTWTVRSDQLSLGSLSIGAVEGADDQMLIVNGEWPPGPVDEGEPIPVLAPEAMFYAMGLQPGDILTGSSTGSGTLDLQVAALWRPVDPNDPAWIFAPKFFNEVLLVSPESLAGIMLRSERPVDEAAWYQVFDGTGVRTADVHGLLEHITQTQRELDSILPGVGQDVSPAAGLRSFSREVDRLTQQLFIIVAPVGGLVLYFVSLVAGLLVQRQRPEDVKLRSRGMSRRALLAVHVLMWLALVGAALGIAVAAGPPVVSLVGRTSSFLRFDGTSSVSHVVLTRQAVAISVATGFVTASSGLFLAWRSTRHTIHLFRQQAVRAGPAWWQRAYLDMLFLTVAGYVFYTLWQRNRLATDTETPFSDPLMFVGPTLFALSLALLFMRFWPRFLTLIAWLVSLTSSIALLMALRELTRSGGRYRGAVLMMAFTLSLTGFTASMASTLDRSLVDTIDYRIGADMVIITAVDTETQREQSEDSDQATYTITGYNVPPAQDLLTFDGVGYVSRVGRYPVQVTVGTQRIDGTIMGIDRGSMAAIARFRDDYAGDSLAGLLNRLAFERTGILLSRTTAERYNLATGQTISMRIQALNTWFEAQVPVVGVLNYFPTLDPAKGVFLVANLDPIFELVGTVLPHDFWLTLESGAHPANVVRELQSRQFPVVDWNTPDHELERARAEPARRGVLGFLSVGFVASIVLTLIAAIVQSTASFRAQSSQLGILRAMGLGARSVSAYIVTLQSLAASSGILSGTGIGVATTLLFLPLLDFSTGLPPYLVRVAGNDIAGVYAVFAGVLFIVTLFTTLLLSREQIATVIRLGDS